MVKSRESFEKLIYKNSKTTFRTQSRTCSSISKLHSESLVLILKKRRPKDNYYESKGKLRRDFSIATDFCILRNYCKNNRDKFSIKKDSKSNHNETEVFSVNECIEHGCGDSFDDIQKTRVNFDLTTLIIDNLKNLVSEWIRKHLLNNDETKNKVDNIVNTILHRLDVKSNTSSCSYAIDVLVDPNLNDLSAIRNAKTATIKHISSITSMITLPLNDNYLKIMSTLSVPRYLMKQKLNKAKERKYEEFTELKPENRTIENRQYVAKKWSMVSIKNERRRSSEQNEVEKIEDFQNIKTQEQHKNVTVNKTEVSRLTYHQLSSFDKDLPFNDVMELVDVENVGSLKTNTETKINKPDSNGYNHQITNKNVNTRYGKLYKKTNYRVKRKRYTIYNNLKPNTMKKGDIVKHIKDLFNCISFIKEISKVKVDISINVLPIAEKEQSADEKFTKNKSSKEYTYTLDKSISRNLIEKSHVNKSQQLFFTTKEDILNSTSNLMTLLDNADSKQKLFASDNNIIDAGANYIKKLINKDFVITNGLEIATEIRELKEIVRSLAVTAKEMLSTHLTAVGERYKDHNKSTITRENKNVPQESTMRIYQKQSKSVQINESFSKSVTASKIDVNKLSKVSTSVFDRNIYKKSTSYRLFDSETILRVTDMTSGANSTLVDRNSDTFETSTQISGSSNDSVANRHKLYAFYCDSMKQPYIPLYSSSGVYYVVSQIKDSDIRTTAVSSKNSGSSKRDNIDVEGKPEESRKSIFDCFHTNFQRKFTLSMFFVVPFIIVLSLVYLYLRGQYFAFKPSPTVFPLLTDKKPLNATELGFR